MCMYPEVLETTDTCCNNEDIVIIANEYFMDTMPSDYTGDSLQPQMLTTGCIFIVNWITELCVVHE